MNNAVRRTAFICLAVLVFSATRATGSGTQTVHRADGSLYRGETAHGLPNGSGVLTMTNGTTYSGGFTNGIALGTGTITWANGDRYSGDVVGGLRHGMGTMVTADGGRQEGYWHRDRYVAAEDFPSQSPRHQSWRNRLIVLVMVGAAIVIALLAGRQKRPKR